MSNIDTVIPPFPSTHCDTCGMPSARLHFTPIANSPYRSMPLAQDNVNVVKKNSAYQMILSFIFGSFKLLKLMLRTILGAAVTAFIVSAVTFVFIYAPYKIGYQIVKLIPHDASDLDTKLIPWLFGALSSVAFITACAYFNKIGSYTYNKLSK